MAASKFGTSISRMFIGLAAPSVTATQMPPPMRARMITALKIAPRLLTHLPTSRRWMPMPTTAQVRPRAMKVWGHLPMSGANISANMPANSRNTEGIHSATLTQYQ